MSGQRPGDRIHCNGCGAPMGVWPEHPIADHCGNCPPWICDGCGQLDSMANPCPCWHSLADDSLADIKAMFAAIDLSVDPS